MTTKKKTKASPKPVRKQEDLPRPDLHFNAKENRTHKQLVNDTKVGGKVLESSLQQRNRLGKAFISRMRADFEKNGIATIEKVRKEKPEVYLNLVSRLVPQQLEVNVQHSFTDVLLEAARRYEKNVTPEGDEITESGYTREEERVIEGTYEEYIKE